MVLKEQVFAIVRFYNFHDSSVAIENRVTVTKVLFEREAAEAEVLRLNKVNGDKSCVYAWQVTRLMLQPNTSTS